MPVYMLKNHYGLVLVGADDPQEALKIIKAHEDHEHNGTHVSLGVPARDLEPVPQEAKGILAYYRND